MNLRTPARAALLTGTVLVSLASNSEADTTGAIQAIAGAAVMGAEITVMTEAYFGLRGNWIYGASSAAGAAAGGAAAYYWVDLDGAYGPQFLVAGGFALFIPAMIGIASAQYFRPETDLRLGVQPDLGFALQLPQWNVGASYTRDQMHRFGVRRSSDFTVYLLNGVF